jgi:hypothetical protein
MKKHLLSIALFSISALASAQNFAITDAGTNVVTGATLTYTIDQSVQDSRHYTFTNTSSGSINVKVRRTILQLNTPTATTSFCTDINCYPPATNMSVQFPVNGMGSFDLTADYTPDNTSGTGHVRYTVINQSNLSDSATFDIIYNATPTGISTHAFAKASISNPAPNPATSVFSINYKLGSTSTEATTMIVYNMLGVRVMQTPLEDFEGTLRMDVSGLDQGIYFCSLESDGKILATRRLVVQH